MIESVAVSSVSQTLTAAVTTTGTYAISVLENGVTFANSGTFTNTGNHDIVLTATGTPITSGTFTYTLSTNPSTSFTRVVKSASSNGTAMVNSWTSSSSSGSLYFDIEANSVTETLTADVTTAGTYSISTISNGITFTGSGTFAGTGNQTVILTAAGRPFGVETSTFAINTTPSVSFTRVVNVNPTTNGTALV
jgi:hypothetical protein